MNYVSSVYCLIYQLLLVVFIQIMRIHVILQLLSASIVAAVHIPIDSIDSGGPYEQEENFLEIILNRKKNLSMLGW